MRAATSELFSRDDWDRYAQRYDCLNDLRPYAAMLESIADIVEASRARDILDAGCGTGNLTARLLRRSTQEALRLTAVDASRAMLDRAKAKNSAKTRNGAADFRYADLDAELPFPDSSFDCVVCVNALYAVADPQGTLREFSRTLRRGGTIIIATPRQGYQNGLILKAHCGSVKPDDYWRDVHTSPEREEMLLREAFQDDEIVAQMLWIADFNRRIAKCGQFHFFTAESLADLFAAAGFDITEQTETYAGQSHLLAAIKR